MVGLTITKMVPCMRAWWGTGVNKITWPIDTVSSYDSLGGEII